MKAAVEQAIQHTRSNPNKIDVRGFNALMQHQKEFLRKQGITNFNGKNAELLTKHTSAVWQKLTPEQRAEWAAKDAKLQEQLS